MSNNKQHNPLYSFLIETKFRWCRHLTLIFFIGIILANDIYITYEGQTGNINIYGIMAGYLLVYLSVLYLNSYLFIPRLLLKAKYIEYTLTLLGTMFILSLGDIFAEYYIHKYYDIPFGQYSFFSPGRNRFVHLVSNFFIFILHLVSVSVVAFYKYWIDNTEKVERLKTEQLHSELDNLKSRISTEFLLNKLHKAAKLCRTSPAKSSRILLQLSRVLRYQLYDCNREKVLLISEIKFLNDYLYLEEICNDNLNFKITIPGTLSNYFIPPLLLISIVEKSLKQLFGREDSIWINLEFSFVGDRLIFTCMDNREIIEMPERTEDYSTLYKRLNLLKSKKYELSTLSDKEQKQYKVIFQYET
jgi:hypothetical protein